MSLLTQKRKNNPAQGILRHLRGLVNTDGVALVGVDRQGTIQEWNQGAKRIFNYSAAEMMGHSVTQLLPAPRRPALRQILEKLTRKPVLRRGDRVLQLTCRRKDGAKILVELHIKPLRERQQIYGFGIAANDISEAERRANELKRANEELAYSREEVRSSYEQLKASQENVVRSEKLAFAARMAASVAHEIRNPLGIVTLSIQQLHKKLKGDQDKQALTEAIQESTERVNRLVTDFVNCTRPQKLRMRRRDIHKDLRKLIAFTKSKCRDHRIRVATHFKEDIPLVFIDQARIGQAFLNIILNAIDAMPRGGNLTMTTDYDAEYVTIQFRDSGTGIAKGNLFRVFDPFFTTKSVGTGLGLAITYSIIASHNGLIAVESQKGRGATFTIRLPRGKQEPAYVNELDLLAGESS